MQNEQVGIDETNTESGFWTQTISQTSTGWGAGSNVVQ